MAKIICKDNFDREGPGHDDRLVAESLNEYVAKRIAIMLNNAERDPHSPNFYDAVPDDYKLNIFKP